MPDEKKDTTSSSAVGKPDNHDSPMGPMSNESLEKSNNPFKSSVFHQYYFGPIRLARLKYTRKLISKKLKRKPRNPLKSADFIQQLSPEYLDANDLSAEKCRHYAKQACICHAATNIQGVYLREAESLTARLLSGITTLHGGYGMHMSESPAAIEKLAYTGNAAEKFLNSNFPQEFRSIIVNGNGGFVDNNTGLCVTFLFEQQPGCEKPTIHIVFPGTGAAGRAISHLTTDLAIVAKANYIPPSFTQARNIVALVKRLCKDKANLEVKGNSLGGAIAAYAGLSNELTTVTLAPLALSPAIWKRLVNEKGASLKEIAQQRLTNLAVEGDFVNGYEPIRRLARKAERLLSVKTLHVLGTSYIVPIRYFPENQRTPALGFAAHSSAYRIWAEFYDKKKAAEKHTVIKVASKVLLEAAAECGQLNTMETSSEAVSRIGLGGDGEPENIEPASFAISYSTGAEYVFLNTINTIVSDQTLRALLSYSARFREIIARGHKLLSSYKTLDQEQKLKALTELERQLVAFRNGNGAALLFPSLRQLYGEVINERDRLSAPPNGWPIQSLDIAVPLEQSRALLDGISAAIKGMEIGSMIKDDFVETKNNVFFPFILRTGDQIAPAAYALIRNAEKSVRLQTYLFFEKSESAKWLHKALDELQEKQRVRRAMTGSTTPIEVEILLDDSRGLAQQNLPGDGGVFQHSTLWKGREQVSRRNKVSNYGIGYPAKLDPALVRLTVKGLKHFQRGSLHSKTILVDDKYCLVCTSNFKGTHHKISMDAQPRFDAGVVFRGDASKAINDDLVATSKQMGPNILGSNALERSIAEEDKEPYSLSKDHQPAVYGGHIEPWQWKGYDLNKELSTAEVIINEIDEFFYGKIAENDLKIVVISKPANNVIYSKTPDSAQRRAFLHAINNAKYFIRISHVNLNVQEVIDALVTATQRNARVEIVLPRNAEEILSGLDAKTNCQAFDEIQSRVEALGKSNFLDLRWQAYLLNEAPVGESHVKYMNVDGVSFFGSTNLDNQSWKYSSELDVATADLDTVNRLDKACFVELFRAAIPFRIPAKITPKVVERRSSSTNETPRVLNDPAPGKGLLKSSVSVLGSQGQKLLWQRQRAFANQLRVILLNVDKRDCLLAGLDSALQQVTLQRRFPTFANISSLQKNARILEAAQAALITYFKRAAEEPSSAQAQAQVAMTTDATHAVEGPTNMVAEALESRAPQPPLIAFKLDSKFKPRSSIQSFAHKLNKLLGNKATTEVEFTQPLNETLINPAMPDPEKEKMAWAKLEAAGFGEFRNMPDRFHYAPNDPFNIPSHSIFCRLSDGSFLIRSEKQHCFVVVREERVTTKQLDILKGVARKIRADAYEEPLLHDPVFKSWYGPNPQMRVLSQDYVNKKRLEERRVQTRSSKTAKVTPQPLLDATGNVVVTTAGHPHAATTIEDRPLTLHKQERENEEAAEITAPAAPSPSPQIASTSTHLVNDSPTTLVKKETAPEQASSVTIDQAKEGVPPAGSALRLFFEHDRQERPIQTETDVLNHVMEPASLPPEIQETSKTQEAISAPIGKRPQSLGTTLRARFQSTWESRHWPLGEPRWSDDKLMASGDTSTFSPSNPALVVAEVHDEIEVKVESISIKKDNESNKKVVLVKYNGHLIVFPEERFKKDGNKNKSSNGLELIEQKLAKAIENPSRYYSSTIKIPAASDERIEKLCSKSQLKAMVDKKVLSSRKFNVPSSEVDNREPRKRSTR